MSRFWSSLTHELRPYTPGGHGRADRAAVVGPCRICWVASPP